MTIILRNEISYTLPEMTILIPDKIGRCLSVTNLQSATQCHQLHRSEKGWSEGLYRDRTQRPNIIQLPRVKKLQLIDTAAYFSTTRDNNCINVALVSHCYHFKNMIYRLGEVSFKYL